MDWLQSGALGGLPAALDESALGLLALYGCRHRALLFLAKGEAVNERVHVLLCWDVQPIKQPQALFRFTRVESLCTYSCSLPLPALRRARTSPHELMMCIAACHTGWDGEADSRACGLGASVHKHTQGPRNRPARCDAVLSMHACVMCQYNSHFCFIFLMSLQFLSDRPVLCRTQNSSY
jgi:hypothetical protein